MSPPARLSGFAVRAALACSAALVANPAPAGDWDLSVAVSSNYLVHGRTRSSNEPALQGHLGTSSDRGWSVGVWASSVKLHPGPGPREEIDLYIAKDWQLARDWRVGSQLTRYEFRGDAPYLSYDYTELAASISFRDAVSASVALAPDYSAYSSSLGLARRRVLMTWELSGRHAVNRQLQLTAGIGRADLEDLFGAAYWYWSGGGELAWRRFSLGVSYIGADDTARRLFGSPQAGNTWVGTVAYRVR